MNCNAGDIIRVIPMVPIPGLAEIRRKAPPGALGTLAGEPDRYRRNVLAYAYITMPVPPILRRPLRGSGAQMAALREYEAGLAEILHDAGIE